MIDHIYLPVSDLERSSEFYKKMLEPLGVDMPYEFDHCLVSQSIPSLVSG